MLVDGPVKLALLTPHLDVRFVDADRAAVRFAELPQPLFDPRRVGQDPAVQGGIVHLNPALQEQLLDIAAAKRVAQVLGDGLHDERRLVVPISEVGPGALFQLRGDGGQDHRPAPKRRP